MFASSRLSPRTWSSASFQPPLALSGNQNMPATTQVIAIHDYRTCDLRCEKENLPIKNARVQYQLPMKKHRSLRTSPKRVYHRIIGTNTSTALLQIPPSSSQPFPYPDQDACFRHVDLQFPLIHTVRSPGLASVTELRPFWLALYFVFNLGLTLYNKLVLVHFPFPYTLTALHALSGTIGGYIMLGSGTFRPARLTARQSTVLAAFSVLYAVNIAVSNVSLNLVTVPFHQVVRALTPIFTLALSAFLFNKRCSQTKMLTLIPVIAGVGLATYGDYYFTAWGFLLTILGTFLAALKTIFTHVLQSPSSSCAPRLIPVLHPLDLLTRMSPLALVQCILYAYLSGELSRVRGVYDKGSSGMIAFSLACNGAIAFGLNVVSLTANKKVGPLSMTVAANVKQALTILVAVTMFNLTITGTNALGISLTLAGGAWYALVEYREKQSAKKFLTGS